MSLTFVEIRLFEKNIRKRIVAFFKVNKLMAENPHRFRSNKSWPINLIDFFIDVCANLDVSVLYDVFYLYFQIAFDWDSSNRLISKCDLME